MHHILKPNNKSVAMATTYLFQLIPQKVWLWNKQRDSLKLCLMGQNLYESQLNALLCNNIKTVIKWPFQKWNYQWVDQLWNSHKFYVPLIVRTPSNLCELILLQQFTEKNVDSSASSIYLAICISSFILFGIPRVLSYFFNC